MRDDFLPFAKPEIAEDAVQEVCQSIRSGWLTTGPKTKAFEDEFSRKVGAKYSVSVSSATSGLQIALIALGIKEGDEVITTPMTFVATINTIIWTGARPILVDVDRNTLNIDPDKLEAAITERTRAIIPVHFAGRPCDMDKIESIAEKHDLAIIEDSAHALGAAYKDRPIGSDRGDRRCSVFSFHPTKNITTGEGGMICTSDEDLAEKAAILRQNGMSKGAWNRYAAKGSVHYDVLFPGFKANMMDIQAAIGSSQLKRLDQFNTRRKEIVNIYLESLQDVPGIVLPRNDDHHTIHSWHIFTPFIAGMDRDDFMAEMKKLNIGTALHYQAVHLFSYYGEKYGYSRGDLPEAEYVSDHIVSLPLFPAMKDQDIEDVIRSIKLIMSQDKR